MPGPVDATTFRRLLGSFATGVTVATAFDADGAPCGMTASAVASVSMDPPLVLLCVDHDADFHAAISHADRFALNILAAEQGAVSERFAIRGGDKFANVPYTAAGDDPPRIDGAIAQIVCEQWQRIEAGDHTVFLGRVVGGSTRDGAPLLYYRGAYRRLS